MATGRPSRVEKVNSMLAGYAAMTWVTIILTVAIVWESLRMVRLIGG